MGVDDPDALVASVADSASGMAPEDAHEAAELAQAHVRISRELYDVLAEPASDASVPGPLRATSLSGVCLGIEETGRLLIESAAGRLAIVSGSLTAPDQVWTGSVSASEAD